jgi:DNA (cytosine-5)-methyltransferase 1
VKNLKSHDKGRTYTIIKNTLEELGYTVYAEIHDAKNYVPQHRERIVITGFRKDMYPDLNFSYPKLPKKKPPTIADILEKEVPDKYTLSDGLWSYLQNYAAKHKAKGNGFGYGLIDPAKDTITRTLSARYYKDGSEILIKQKGKNPRRLMPRECARLMGFGDSFIIPVSDMQAYKQFGNALCVPLLTAVAKQMIKTMKEYKIKHNYGQKNKRTAKQKYGEYQVYEYVA